MIEKSKYIKYKMIGAGAAIVLGVVALVVALACYGKEVELRILKSFAIGFISAAFTFAIAGYIICASSKRRTTLLAAEIATILGIMVLLILVCVKWWLVFIIVFALCALAVLSMFYAFADKLELIADNASPDYKDYKQRKAEKEATATEEKEELPEIKSFK